MTATWSHDGEVVRISVCALMHVLDQDPEIGNCTDNGLHLYYLTMVLATNQLVIACSLSRNRNLACGEGTRLHCCIVFSVVGEFGMAIIMLGRLYFMLSCQLTPIDVALMLHGDGQ
jgi:hypothetical protein